MNREEMLQKLHAVKVGVELTALISENVLECEYVSSTGTHYEWIGLNDWPVCEIKLPQSFDLLALKKEISDGTFKDSSISETAVERLYTHCLNAGQINIDIATFLSKLADISKLEENTLYALINEGCVLFFESYAQLEDAFESRCLGTITPWESYSNEELEQWMDRLETEFKGIPFASY